jgi:uncharacterized protein (DUF427 family)
MADASVHRIDIAPFKGRVQVRWRGNVIADTTQALQLDETRHGPVYYVPRADAKMELFERSTHHTHCPHKGDASYYSLVGPDGARADDAVWTYEAPIAKSAPIKDYLAFYTRAMKPSVDIDVVATG